MVLPCGHMLPRWWGVFRLVTGKRTDYWAQCPRCARAVQQGPRRGRVADKRPRSGPQMRLGARPPPFRAAGHHRPHGPRQVVRVPDPRGQRERTRHLRREPEGNPGPALGLAVWGLRQRAAVLCDGLDGPRGWADWAGPALAPKQGASVGDRAFLALALAYRSLLQRQQQWQRRPPHRHRQHRQSPGPSSHMLSLGPSPTRTARDMRRGRAPHAPRTLCSCPEPPPRPPPIRSAPLHRASRAPGVGWASHRLGNCRGQTHG